MARFDIYTVEGSKDLALDIQSDFLAHLPTRLVIPLLQKQRLSVFTPQIHLPIELNEAPYYMATNLITALRKSQLRKRVGSAADRSHEITTAIDFLLQGF
jgi:toxin CcdB